MNWSTKADRARLAHIEEERERYLSQASDQPSEDDRRAFERRALLLNRQERMARTYPLSIWLFGLGVLAPLLVWSLAARHQHQTAGLIGGGVIALAEGLLVSRRRR